MLECGQYHCQHPTRKIYRSTIPKCVHGYVMGAISRKGHLPLVFIDRGVKTNAKYYKTEVLERILLLEAQKGRPPSLPDLNPLDFSIWGYMLGHQRNDQCANCILCRGCLTRYFDLMCRSINFSTVFKKKDVRLIGLYDLGCSGSLVPAFGI
jgi:hypothetical protein